MPENTFAATLPVTIGGVTKFHRLVGVSLGQEKPSLPTNLVAEVKHAPTKRVYTTVRIHVPKAFVSKEQWPLWCSRPGSVLQDWSPQTKTVHTSYGWVNTHQKNWHGSLEEFVLGYAKVEAHDVQTVLDRSERSGVFVSRLAKECARC